LPKIVNKDEKRNIILKSAIRIFSQKGAAATRVQDIALDAGIGKGTIYEYFKSKDEIFKASFYFFIEETNSMLAQRIYNVKDPLEKLSTFFDAWVEIVDLPSMKSFSLMIEFWAEGIRQNNNLEDFNLVEIYRMYRLQIQNLLDDCIANKQLRQIDTHIVAASLIGALDGIMIQWVLEPEVFDIQKALRTLQDIFMTGLGII